MIATNGKAAGCTTTATAQGTDNSHKSTTTSTGTEAQLARLAGLLQRGPRHTHELRRHGISHPAARVLDLVKRGWNITSDRISTVDSDGFTHNRVARYSLISKPAAVSALAKQLGGRDGH
jgi:hypothetical protein